MPDPVDLTPEYKRHMAAYWTARRLGGTLAIEIDRVRKLIFKSLSNESTVSDLLQLADVSRSAVAYLRRVIPAKMSAGFASMVRRYHVRTARILTAIANKQESRHILEDIPGIVTDYDNLIIDPPTEAEIERIAGNGPAKLTSLIDVDDVSNLIRTGIATGRTTAQIARDISATFDVMMTDARRISRTEGLRIATQTQLAVSEQIPELVVGYEINAVDNGHSPTSRPEHKKRHGTKYYREPPPGRKSMEEMPQPPIESDGSLSYNCRCFLVPIISGDTMDDR